MRKAGRFLKKRAAVALVLACAMLATVGAQADTAAKQYVNDGTVIYSNAKKYDMDQGEASYVAYVCETVQGTTNQTAIACEASYIANLYDGLARKEKRNDYPTVYDFVKTSGLFPYSESYRTESDSSAQTVLSVITEGNRCLPQEVTEYDELANIKSASNDGEAIDKSDRAAYVSGTTQITNSSGDTYTFYCWSHSSSGAFGGADVGAYEGGGDELEALEPSDDWTSWNDEENQEIATTVFTLSDWNNIWEDGTLAFLYNTDGSSRGFATDIADFRVTYIDKREGADDKTTIAEYFAAHFGEDAELMMAVANVLSTMGHRKYGGVLVNVDTPFDSIDDETDYFCVALMCRDEEGATFNSATFNSNMESAEVMYQIYLNCCAAYNRTHEDTVDSCTKDTALKTVLQGIIFGEDYAKTSEGYSEEDAAAYSSSLYSDARGLDKTLPKFAERVLDKYTILEIEEHHVTH